MIDWLVIYGDGSECNSDDCSPFDVPGQDVQACASRTTDDQSQKGYEPVFGWDFYVWRDDQWYGCEIFGLWDYLVRPGPKKVLFGRTVSNDAYRAAVKRICDAKELERQPTK